MNEHIITSVQNSKIQQIRSLKQKRTRDELDLFIAEGDKVIEDAIKAKLNILDIFLVDSKTCKFDTIVALAKENDIHVNIINEKVLSSISQTKSPQGIVALIRKNTPVFSFDAFTDANFIAILEAIKDPGNLGTIIRTCDAVGVDLIITENCSDIYNPKVIRASMGSIFHLPCYDTSICKCVNFMKDNDWQIGCGHLHGDNFYSRKQKQKIALVIGNESRGVSESTSTLCTDLWKLPMNGKADSLNASIAAGVMLYDIHNISKHSNK